MSYKYTFLLPVYKRAFLDEAIQSIQKQTYEDFKVLISDDCSPDNIFEICEPYMKDSRFSYRRNDNNMGNKSLVSHWNLLLSLCETDFLIMASDDDEYESNFLEEVDKLLTSYPKIDLVRARCRRINDMGECYEEDSYTSEFEDQLRFLYSSFSTDRIHCIGNYVFRTDVIKAKGGFIDFPLAWFSDDASIVTCSEHGVVNTDKLLFKFRSSDINISSVHNTNVEGALRKIEASKMFYIWMTLYLKSSFDENSLSALYNNIYHKIVRQIKERVYKQILNYSPSLSFCSLFLLLRWMSQYKLIEGKRQKVFFVIDSLR